MCQLTYCNLHDAYLNTLMIYFLSTIGSVRHDDGCGVICSDNKIWKSKHQAKNLTNLGEILYESVQDNKPVPFHIRMATHGIAVNDENAHPFTGKHFILMHNGTLLPKDGSEPKDKEKDSDSLRFLNALDAMKDKKKDTSFPEIFNETMENFSGKFAFIIRDIDTKTDYIVRGKTAELYVSYLTINGKASGYVVNTSNSTMKDAFMQFINVASLSGANNYELSEPTLLAIETIFVGRDKGLDKLGETKETTVIKPAIVAQKNNSSSTALLPPSRVQSLMGHNSNFEQVGEILTLSNKIYEYLSDHSLELIDLQMMFHAIAGISLLEITREDLKMFVQYMIPKVSCEKIIRNRVKTLLNGKRFPDELYEAHKLEYPWPVNEGKILKNVIKSLELQAKA